MTILSPGAYLIELEFTRPVNFMTLNAALEKMGFVRLTPDDTAAATIGAVATLGKRRLSSLSTTSVATRVATTPTVTSTYRPPTTTAPTTSPTTALRAPSVTTVSKAVSIATQPVTTVAVAKPPVTSSPSTPSAPATLGKRKLPTTPSVMQPRTPATPCEVYERAKAAGQNAAILNALRIKCEASKGGGAASASAPGATLGKRRRPGMAEATVSVPVAQPAPAPTPGTLGRRRRPGMAEATVSVPIAEPEPAPSGGGTLGKRRAPAGGGGGGGGGGDASAEAYEEETYAEDPGVATATSNAPAPADDTIKSLWKRWKEWGSPFAAGPSVSGLDETPAYRFRFIAQLANPLRIGDLPGMRWLYVRRLGMNPFGDLDFSFKPFKLVRGSRYELRFLSRPRAMPTRDDVKKGLVDMGFAPVKLSLMHSNMRVPNRAGNSVAMWYAIAVWEKGSTTVTERDPFFFLNAQEIAR